MAPGGPDLCHVTPRASTPSVTQRTMSTLDLATTVARGVAATAMEILERFTWPQWVNEADHPPVHLAADAAIWERAISLKHPSQSWPRDEADPKKGRMEGKGKPSKNPGRY